MKLQAGRKYKCRNGYEPILEDFKRGSGYVCKFMIPNGENIYASETGKIFISTQIESEWDIIEEVKEEPIKLDHYEDADAFAIALLNKQQKPEDGIKENQNEVLILNPDRQWEKVDWNKLSIETIKEQFDEIFSEKNIQEWKRKQSENVAPLDIPTVEAQRQAIVEINKSIKKGLTIGKAMREVEVIKPDIAYHQAKQDNGKPRFSLLRIDFIEKMMDVMEFGAKKYAKNSWQIVPDGKERYQDAAARHLFAHLKGEQKAEDSGISHLAHAAVNLMFVDYFEGIDQV
jgi:hypothetical protein